MRTVVNISHDWLFDNPLGKGQPEAVTLPHSICLTPANSSGGRNLLAQVEYRRTLTLPESEKGKKILLRMEGIMGISRAYLNGELIGENLCGYIPLEADLTDRFRFGEDNELRILADNRPDPDVPPGKNQDDLDFTYDGGIYREARLIILPRICFTEPLLREEKAGGGIFVWTKSADRTLGVLGVRAEIENGTEETCTCQCRVTVLDRNRVPVGSQTLSCTQAPGEYRTLETEISLENPALWSPEDPNLYQVVCELLQDGEVLDRISLNTGLRFFQYTFDRGILWNGESRRISGANYHPTFPYIGASVPGNLLRRDIRKLRRLGMKNLRCHYPFDEDILDECDRLGITVIVSNPGWQWYRDGIFARRLEENMRRIVRWQRNHPSIILWEPMPNESVVPQEIQQRLHDAVHEEYPWGCCYTASDHGPTDVSYRQFDPGMLEPGMEGYDPCKRYGSKSDYPVWIREYDDAPDNWKDQSCAWRSPRGWGDHAMVRSVERMLGLDPQCDQNYYLDIYNKPNICGYGMWPGIEHNRGYHINPCWGGMLDLFRLPKFTADFMRSQLDRQETGDFIAIANWWTDVSPQDVTVYSNAEAVRLYHNGVLVEERRPEPMAIAHPPFLFRDVWRRFRTRDRGTLRAEALVGGEVAATATQMTPGVPCQLRLEADLEGIPLKAEGEDMILVHCSVLDREGNVSARYADNHPIRFSLTGAAEIVGDETVGANPVFPEAGICSILIRSQGAPGPIEIRAEPAWPQGNVRRAIRPDTLTLESV